MKAAIYTRVSTDNQAEVEFNSCEAQEAKIKAFISSQESFEIYKVYKDEGYSGANLDRPGLAGLLADIEQNNINMVIVYKIDRLTRSPKDFYNLIEIFEKHSISFISVTERFDTSTPSGRLLRNIMLTFAQFERELTSERTKDKMLERAKKGLYGGGGCPLGYKRVNKRLEIEPSEAETVRKVFSFYIKTASLFKTYKLLKQRGVLNRQNKILTKGEISSILRKLVYTGKIYHQGKVYPGIHRPIISEEQFNQAQELHKQKIVPNWKPAKNYLLPGMIFCKECGSKMTPTYTNKIKKTMRKRYYYYRCTITNKRDWDSCSIRHVSASRLDGFILNELNRISKDGLYLESLSFMHNQKQSGIGQGFELSNKEPCLTAEKIQTTIQNVLRIASIKETYNRALALRNYIDRVIYSKETIEIRFLENADNTPLVGDFQGAGAKSRRPKMGGGIFGRSIKAGCENVGVVNAQVGVCGKRNLPRAGFEPAWCYPLTPEASASANSATSARGQILAKSSVRCNLRSINEPPDPGPTQTELG